MSTFSSAKMTGNFMILLFLGILYHSYLNINTENNFPLCSSSALSVLHVSGLKKRSFPESTQIKCVQKSTPLTLLLILSGDIQLNPGPRPPKYPCGICHKACKWTTPCVRCDTCKVYYHKDCMLMPDGIFNNLNNISWECFHCGVPNFSSSFFNSSIDVSSPNRFKAISPENSSGHSFVFGSPVATSSPSHERKRHHPRKSPNLPLKVLVINCRDMSGKRPLLESLLDATDADIIIGTESWLSSDIKSNEIFPPDYNVFRKDRPQGKEGGGVFILTNSKFDSDEPADLKSQPTDELLWVRMKVKGERSLYIGSFYRPPRVTDPDYFKALENTLPLIPNDAHIWLGGDFNLADIDWNLQAPKTDANLTTCCRRLLSITQDFFLDQVVRFPTRTTEDTSNILDLFFTNNKTLVNRVEPLPGISDHDTVFIEISLSPVTKPTVPRKINLFHKADFDNFKKDILASSFELGENANILSVEEYWQQLKKLISDLTSKHVPSKTIKNRPNFKPWITSHVKRCLRKVKAAYRKMRNSNSQRLIDKYKHLKAESQRIQRNAYWRYINSLFEPSKDTEIPAAQKRFWNYIKSLKKDNTGVSALKENGKLHPDPTSKANILNRQYQSVFTHEDKTHIPTPDGLPFPSMPEITVNPAGVEKLLRQLNPSKASGPDNIPAKILKECSRELAPLITTLFTKTIQEGKIPCDWKEANITAVFKKGDRNIPSNYRPVSLTSIICKLQEHIIVSNVLDHLDHHNILTDCQHGFRA